MVKKATPPDPERLPDSLLYSGVPPHGHYGALQGPAWKPFSYMVKSVSPQPGRPVKNCFIALPTLQLLHIGLSPGCQPVRIGAQSNLGKHWYLRSVGFRG